MLRVIEPRVPAMHARERWLSLLLAALAALLVLPAAAETRPLVLAGGTVIDGYGNPPLHNGVIIIEGEKIVAVGSVGQLAIPENAEVISTEGMTVLPGLWDLQAHLTRLGHADEQRWADDYLPIAERVGMPLAATQLLAAGVTSARDAGAPLNPAIRVRDRINERRIPGPTLFVSGPVLRKTVRPGAGSWQLAVVGEADARAQVARLAAAGVDYVLIDELDLWTDAELSAAMNEARVRGLPVHARAGRASAIERALEAGVDGFLGIGVDADSGYPQELYRAIERRAQDTTRRPLVWSPALSGVFNYEDLRGDREPLDDPALVAGLPPIVALDLLGSLARLELINWYEMPAVRAPTLCTKLRQLEMAGVRLVIGSDSGAPAHLHSRATAQEIDAWVRVCGLDPMLAIRAATHDAAAALRVEHLSGTLTPGKVADIIAVRGDALRHPVLLQRLDIVISRGLRYR
jgi:imidazolonepropionase-like amidohydrolase